MADERTMAQMLQAPIEGYEDPIVVPLINANNFELKQTLINLVQSNQFTGRQDPHNHLCFFNKDKEHEATTDTELLSTEDIHPLAIQEPPQESDICQLIEECFVEVPEQQKQNMEKTMLDLVKICHHKQFLCIHDDVDDLME
nr:reverse transcriptase domain-containing protein [Tanacetum cinerariifolium]